MLSGFAECFKLATGFCLNAQVETVLVRFRSLFGQKTDAIPIRAEMIYAIVGSIDADPSLMAVIKEPLNDAAAILCWLDGAPILKHCFKRIKAATVLCIYELCCPSAKV